MRNLGRLVVLGASLLACGSREQAGAGAAFRPMTVGAPVPAYEVVTYAGDTVRVGAGGRGPVTLLNVWATWCIPCRKEFPALDTLHRRYAARGLRVVGVSVDVGGSDQRVQGSARDLGGTFPIARDADGVIQERFRTIGVPESYLIGADGTLLWRHPGDLTPRRAELEALVAAQLGGPAS